MPVNFRCRSNSNREDRPPRVIGIAVMLLPAALLAAACTSARPDPAPDDSADAGVTREISSSSVPRVSISDRARDAALPSLTRSSLFID